jgi:hypothetical protein
MRAFVLVTILLASSSLYPTFAQEEGKAPVAAPQMVPAQTDQSSQRPQQDQRNGGDQPQTDNREVGRDLRTRPGEGDRMGRDDREMGRDWRMHRDREAGRDRNMDRGRR